MFAASRLVRRLADHPSIRVLDLSRVTFIDSAGLRAIVEATRADPNLAIHAPSACVLRLCTLAGLDDIPRVAASEWTSPPGAARANPNRAVHHHPAHRRHPR